METSPNDLFILHTNIRSLSLHFDDLVLCGQTTKSIDIIGVSETRHSMQNGDLGNIDIEGYKFYKTMSLGLYIKNTLVSNPCK